MPRLSSQRALPRFAAAVNALYDAATTSAPDALAQASARAVAELIPCESSSYNHLVTSDGCARAPLAIAHHPAPPPAELQTAFEAHMDKHVSFQVVQAQGIQDAVRLSDFISSRAFRRTAFYQEYYRPRGTRFQLGFAFPASATSTITVALNRWLRDFSDDDRALLTLLRPHFQRAYEMALTRWLCGDDDHAAPDTSFATTRTPVHADDRPRGAWVRVTADGRLRDCPALVRSWLELHGRAAGADRLPDALRRWWQDRTAPRVGSLPKIKPSLVLENDAGRRLTARVLRGPPPLHGKAVLATTDEGLLHLEEEPAVDRAAALRALGLTPRQAEVLFWIAHGKTNEEIGVILGASRHTVNHHVEAILGRLGVVSRTEASLRALEALGWLHWPGR